MFPRSEYPAVLGRPRDCFAPALLLLALGLTALFADVPIARWLLNHGFVFEFQRFVDLSEVFGHGYGVLMILLAIWTVDVSARRRVPRVLLLAFSSGLAANAGKLLIARSRPANFDLSARVLDSFEGWLPMLNNTSHDQGLPSSHVATAVGLAIGLSWLYPRGRYLFFTFAAFVALQRLTSGAHFVSDAFWGASVAGLICGVYRIPTWLNDRWISWETGRRPVGKIVPRHAPQSRTNEELQAA